MFSFLRRRPAVQTTEAAASLSERLINWAVAVAGVLFPGLGGVLMGLWSWEAAEAAAPFAAGFAIVMAVAFRVWWLNERGAHNAPVPVALAPPQGGAPPPPLPLPPSGAARAMLRIGQRTYVGRVDVDTNRLGSDFVLEFAFIAFNGTPSPLRLVGLRGRIGYCESITGPGADWTMLPTPAVRDDNVTAVAPFSEFMVVVCQSVPGALAAEMGRALSAGRRVMFVLEDLTVVVAAESDEEQGRLPVWERVTCERWGERTITGRIALASAHLHIA